MSAINVDEASGRNSSDEVLQEDSEDSYLTEEEILNETFSDSLIKLRRVSLRKNRRHSKDEAHKEKNGFCRVSVRCGKRNRLYNVNKKSKKIIRRQACKKTVVKCRNCLEKPVETPKKGKRCRVGGKAKGKPPEEENNEKCESDEESENYFFSRVSLGFFQKFKDLSGASTSNQWEEEHKRPITVNSQGKMRDEISEEMELLELQNWGMTKHEELEKLKYLNPDTL